jgi:asparagine synthase (glutamine-hydrolysing)
MCGIAGLIGPAGSSVDRPLLEGMTRALVHRGPDGDGFFAPPGQGIGLGHRRLRIIDLDTGDQPMRGCTSRDVWVVFNGEIYNFQELRRELEGRGHAFHTRSDTEVIVHGYEEWGDAVLERLRGMFALCVWDGQARRALLARDRMGKKPLYYAHTGTGLAFASELKALLMHPRVDRRLDARAVIQYLVHEYVPAPASIVRGVRKLGPGERLTFEPDRAGGAELRPSRYHDLVFPAPGEMRIADPDEAADELRGLLKEAVRRRLVSDVPLGVFLSGGIDSSTVVALMAEERDPATIDTFAIGFRDPSFDESSHARMVARAFGTRHHEERLEPKTLLDLLPDVARIVDEPLGDASIVPTHLLARFTRRRVTVALGGDGGDELLAGYPTFQADLLARGYDRAPPAIDRLLRRVVERLPVSTANFSRDFKARQFLRGADLAGVARHQAWLGSFLPSEALAAVSADVREQAAREDPLADLVIRANAAGAADPSDRLLWFYCRYYLEGDILVKVDRATMAASLEARAPFLDEDVVRFACRVAPGLRMRGLKTKVLLKRAMRGRLPKAVLDRPKKGFGIPVARWLKAELRPLLLDLLGPGPVRRSGLLDANTVDRLIREHLAGRRDHRKPLWTLLMLAQWQNVWGSASA